MLAHIYIPQILGSIRFGNTRVIEITTAVSCHILFQRIYNGCPSDIHQILTQPLFDVRGHPDVVQREELDLLRALLLPAVIRVPGGLLVHCHHAFGSPGRARVTYRSVSPYSPKFGQSDRGGAVSSMARMKQVRKQGSRATALVDGRNVVSHENERRKAGVRKTRSVTHVWAVSKEEFGGYGDQGTGSSYLIPGIV
jgi:hypothetical protein